MQRSTITAVLVTSLVFTGLTGFVSSATQDEGTQIQLCVNQRTKVVTYSKSWSKCPSGSTAVKVGRIGPQGLPGAQGPQGVMGPSGSNGSSVSVWDSVDNCHQKLNLAIGAGYLMAVKSDRQSFESKTGCIVEEIKNPQKISFRDRLNHPVISNWEYMSFGGVNTGDGIFGNYTYLHGEVRYKLTISDVPEGFSFCEIPSENKLTNMTYIETTPDGKAIVETRLVASFENFSSQLELVGLREENGSCEGYDTAEDVITIFEDPARFIGTDHFQDHLAWWGWR